MSMNTTIKYEVVKTVTIRSIIFRDVMLYRLADIMDIPTKHLETSTTLHKNNMPEDSTLHCKESWLHVRLLEQTCVQFGWQQNYFERFKNIYAEWTAIKETKGDQVKKR
jgi:hypothetical protein